MKLMAFSSTLSAANETLWQPLFYSDQPHNSDSFSLLKGMARLSLWRAPRIGGRLVGALQLSKGGSNKVRDLRDMLMVDRLRPRLFLQQEFDL